MKLQRCHSHEMNNSPRSFETVLVGSGPEIADYYDDLPHISRVSNGYQVQLDDGDTVGMEEFFWHYAEVKHAQA